MGDANTQETPGDGTPPTDGPDGAVGPGKWRRVVCTFILPLVFPSIAILLLWICEDDICITCFSFSDIISFYIADHPQNIGIFTVLFDYYILAPLAFILIFDIFNPIHKNKIGESQYPNTHHTRGRLRKPSA
jgi:hypothetical protein